MISLDALKTLLMIMQGRFHSCIIGIDRCIVADQTVHFLDKLADDNNKGANVRIHGYALGMR